MEKQENQEVTHNLKNDDDDEIIQYLRKAPLVNNPLDKVKIVYHPDFIDSSSPLFGIDYNSRKYDILFKKNDHVFDVR